MQPAGKPFNPQISIEVARVRKHHICFLTRFKAGEFLLHFGKELTSSLNINLNEMYKKLTSSIQILVKSSIQTLRGFILEASVDNRLHR